jgi:hypothetical protein
VETHDQSGIVCNLVDTPNCAARPFCKQGEQVHTLQVLSPFPVPLDCPKALTSFPDFLRLPLPLLPFGSLGCAASRASRFAAVCAAWASMAAAFGLRAA